MKLPVGIVLLAIACAARAGDPGPPPSAPPSVPRLDRNYLLQYRATNGAIEFGTNVAAWEIRRTQILAAMQEVMGPLPGPEKRCPLDVKTEVTVDRGSYDSKVISSAPEPGARVLAYLLVLKHVDASGGAHL